MAGILRYGSYVPYCRLQRARFEGGGRGERAIANFDEDATSLAVEAAREAMRGSAPAPATLLFASTSHAYAEKLNAAGVHAALDLPSETRLADLSSSSGAGVAALGLASASGTGQA
ncbi:MAG: hydroxymethylglutaryl-CoA synthase, partial [Acidobacteriia bacterium]|nr:hydroxymethylglutaryl-CoA synthase [Terriglobia bacterium]